MQAAKKLVLLDEQDREYKRLQRPTPAIAKTRKSLKLTDTLRDPSVADDRKVRQYIAALQRSAGRSERECQSIDRSHSDIAIAKEAKKKANSVGSVLTKCTPFCAHPEVLAA